MQADCILLVAPENASPDVTAPEYETVWRLLMPPDPAGTPRASSTGSRRASGQDVNSKMSSLDAATLGGVDTSSGACFTAESDEVSSPHRPVARPCASSLLLHSTALCSQTAPPCSTPPPGRIQSTRPYRERIQQQRGADPQLARTLMHPEPF